MISRHELRYRKLIKTTEYGAFIIGKTQEVKRIETTTRCGFSFYKDITEIPVRGTIRYEAWTKEDSGMQAMTEEYKTLKEVKAAINNREYIEY